MRRTAMILALSSTLAMISCAGEEETPKPATASVEGLIGGVCDLLFRCCERGEINFLLGPYVDQSDCVSRLVQASTLSSTSFELDTFSGPKITLPNIAALERALADRRIGIDPDSMKACENYLAGLACAVPLDEDDPDTCVPPKPEIGDTPCDPVNLFVGLVAERGICSSDLLSMECAHGLACARDGDLGVEGECVPTGRIGDKCFTFAECGIHVNEGELAPGQNRREHLYCSQADGTCQKFRREGETCLYADREDPSPDPSTALIRCAGDLSCDHVTDLCVRACQRGAACFGDNQCDEEQELVCISGRCDQLRGEGAACDADDDCVEPLRCASDPADPTRDLCTKRLPIGDVCFGHSACESGFCDPITQRCEAQVAPGGLCPSGQNAECDMGVCTSEFISCSSDAECPGSNKCDLVSGQCEYYCVALKPDGATCTYDDECDSTECAAGYCRTLPLEDGVACDGDFQCDSEFCSLDLERVCKKLPLDLGEPCSESDQCESEVCFQDSFATAPTCVNGLDEGEACGSFDQAPCSPKTLYCNAELEPAACSLLKLVGEDCESSVQCRGECQVAFNRQMCFPPGDPDLPLCDGETSPGSSNE